MPKLPYNELPEHMRGAAKRYIENGILPGNFLTAVVENDLFEALGRADTINRERLFDIVSFFYNHAPSSCHGSPKFVESWVRRGGLEGMTK